VIVCPGWNESASEPITLVHGVYGSGKSFLAAVVIIFIQEIVELACERRGPEDHFEFKILITSMTVSGWHSCIQVIYLICRFTCLERGC
jgi:hypothetical protein